MGLFILLSVFIIADPLIPIELSLEVFSIYLTWASQTNNINIFLIDFVSCTFCNTKKEFEIIFEEPAVPYNLLVSAIVLATSLLL